MKKIQQENYFSQTEQISNVTIANKVFSDIMDNLHYFNATFTNITFKDIVLQHVTFELCTIRNCLFQNASAIQTYFQNSSLQNSIFNNTNFYSYKFVNSELKNTPVLNTFEGCEVDFGVNVSTESIFLENFLGQLAVIPGTLITAALVDRVGRIRMLGKGIIFLLTKR